MSAKRWLLAAMLVALHTAPGICQDGDEQRDLPGDGNSRRLNRVVLDIPAGTKSDRRTTAIGVLDQKLRSFMDEGGIDDPRWYAKIFMGGQKVDILGQRVKIKIKVDRDGDVFAKFEFRF